MSRGKPAKKRRSELKSGDFVAFRDLPPESRFAFTYSPDMFPYLKTSGTTCLVLLLGDQLGNGSTEKVDPGQKVIFRGIGVSGKETLRKLDQILGC